MMSRDHILYRDDDILIVNKPAGIATHPGPGCPEKTSCLQEVRKLAGRWVFPVHRLDRATSGVLVFALTEESARILGGSFAHHQVEKEYRTIVRGHITGDGVIDKALPHPTNGVLQEALTAYHCLMQTEVPWPVRPYSQARYTLLSLRPTTGRTHQLRRHMSSISHPILGDTRYGDGAHNRAFREKLGTARLFLHARQVRFLHPRSGEPVEITTPDDTQWQDVLSRLGLKA